MISVLATPPSDPKLQRRFRDRSDPFMRDTGSHQRVFAIWSSLLDLMKAMLQKEAVRSVSVFHCDVLPQVVAALNTLLNMFVVFPNFLPTQTVKLQVINLQSIRFRSDSSRPHVQLACYCSIPGVFIWGICRNSSTKSTNQLHHTNSTNSRFESWLLAIACLTQLWDHLQPEHNLSYLFTSRLNQDIVENLFATVRWKGGCRDNPNAKEFRCALRALLHDDDLNTNRKSGVAFPLFISRLDERLWVEICMHTVTQNYLIYEAEGGVLYSSRVERPPRWTSVPMRCLGVSDSYRMFPPGWSLGRRRGLYDA
ncbi:Transposable element P transposase [Merluccius polli]|uniref:Transposable element P transposase n=1 Tax=Merluccius polli TaxID=89951 RepID=A0AA47NLW7_MERPO|nr:Transposable element P transposase [Merluccius polli]